MGFRLIGIDGVVIHTADEVVETVNSAIEDKNIALIMITEHLVSLCTDFIYGIKFSKRIQIVQIPDRHGSRHDARSVVGGYLQSALGVNIK